MMNDVTDITAYQSPRWKNHSSSGFSQLIDIRDLTSYIVYLCILYCWRHSAVLLLFMDMSFCDYEYN